jgi:hypothetical protein
MPRSLPALGLAGCGHDTRRRHDRRLRRREPERAPQALVLRASAQELRALGAKPRELDAQDLVLGTRVEHALEKRAGLDRRPQHDGFGARECGRVEAVPEGEQQRGDHETHGENRDLPALAGARRGHGPASVLVGVNEDLVEVLGSLEDAAGATHDTGERIVGDTDREVRHLAHQEIEAAQQRTASGEEDAAIHDVRRQLGRRLLERFAQRVHRPRAPAAAGTPNRSRS